MRNLAFRRRISLEESAVSLACVKSRSLPAAGRPRCARDDTRGTFSVRKFDAAASGRTADGRPFYRQAGRRLLKSSVILLHYCVVFADSLDWSCMAVISASWQTPNASHPDALDVGPGRYPHTGWGFFRRKLVSPVLSPVADSSISKPGAAKRRRNHDRCQQGPAAVLNRGRGASSRTS